MDVPIYVVGAGFSRAVSPHMPVTDELGALVKEQLNGAVEMNLRPGQTFEEWFTLQTTSLPFLEGHRNARRLADAERVVAQIAEILDERTEMATVSNPPLWLQQIIAIWDAERATVITFNYDTLIERAINTSPIPVIDQTGEPDLRRGDHVAFPAPNATTPQYFSDFFIPVPGETLQLIKLHGSLNWYWKSGDPTGATLVRLRETRKYDQESAATTLEDPSGIETLDRYLIPPLTSKDGYYSSYLAGTLWRTARKRLEASTSVTFIGYSLPLEDRVTNQLFAESIHASEVTLVNLEASSTSTHPRVTDRLELIGLPPTAVWPGVTCVRDFVASRVRELSDELRDELLRSLPTRPSADVVVLLASNGRAVPHLLLRDSPTGSYRTYPVHQAALDNRTMPFRESVLNDTMAPGEHELSDFLTIETLQALLREGTFEFYVADGTTPRVGIRAESATVGAWEVVHLRHAPVAR